MAADSVGQPLELGGAPSALPYQVRRSAASRLYRRSADAPVGVPHSCGRLMGNNEGASPMRLSGNVLEGEDFLCSGTRSCRLAEGCAACAVRSFCTATCPCSNYVRSGDPGRPDGLLCLLNRSCIRETARVMDVLPEGLII